MNYLKQNQEKTILALLTFILSLIVYLDTVAPTVSFWDCGEFIATSFTLGVPHPPGSPLFLLIGRFFAMLPIGNDIAYRVNLMSPIVSAFAVMFLFLIIVQLVKKWENPSNPLYKIILYSGAFIGAMTFAYTDSHWFNAVEAEVYAFSTFLTAIVVWLILVWEEHADKPGHERYLLIIAYIMGLAMGIHLLNLLAIFFIALIIYFKRHDVNTLGWFIADIIIGTAIVAVLFVFFRQVTDSTTFQAFWTLGVFMGIYVLVYKTSQNERLVEHARNTLMAFFASAIFLVINGGVIRGLPNIADKMGLAAVGVLIAVIFIGTFFCIKKRYNIASLALMALILIIVGYSSYTTIFIRSSQNPTIDENDPETTHQALAYLEREQYGRREFADIFNRAVWKPEAEHKYTGAGDYFWKYQIKHMYIRYFNWQFIGRLGDRVDPFQFFLPFPFLIGIYGMLSHFRRDKHKALSILALFLFTGLMIVLYLNQDDPQPRERDYSYVGSFFTFAIWIGIGVSSIIGQIAQLKNEKIRTSLAWMLTATMLIVLPLNILVANYHEHDRSGNFVASDYSYNILQTCEPDGIIFTNGDNDTFPLWYLQEVEHVRQDVRVVNLSLLNTDWYIRQLRDNEPKVDLGNLSDEIINSLTVRGWKPQRVKISPPPGSDLAPLEWELKPTIMGQGIRVQDIMILHLLEMNKWKRPVYFAVTVSPENRLGMEEFLQMEGLAFRVNPKKVKRVNGERLQENIFNVYRYRNLDNPHVYFNDNIVKLIGNYRSGFFQLALEKLYDNDLPGMVATLDSMAVRLPEDIVPIQNDDVSLQLGMLYHEGGRSEELARRLEYRVNRPKNSLKDMLRFASIYYQELNEKQTALDILENLYKDNPGSGEVIGLLVRLYGEMKNYDTALNILDEWIALHPTDVSATRMRDEFRRELARLPRQDRQATETDSSGS